MNKPLVFLNIDGVLISEEYIRNNYSDISKLYTRLDNKYYMTFEASKVDLIKEIVEEVDADIVISSYWCSNINMDTIKKLFDCYGLSDRIVGMVPFDVRKNGFRVRNWIDKNNKKNNYAIIDNDEIGILEDKQIKCDSNIGITNSEKNKVIKLIKK